jgi:predicted ATPase/class 3 adenylate cyclase
VYLAHDSKLDRDVAFALIKTEGLDADGIVRVRREAQAMGRLGDHAHIVTIFDTGDEDGAPFIVSQYRGGGSVEDLLAKAEQHRIPPERAMKIGEQICLALQHAHGRGVIHRDLKPGNVWLDADGIAALGDFGLAIAIDRSRMTMAGMMVGTVAYMPPEQALGRTPDARSDLYALGAMLYEMVCGRPPFLGDDAVGVISQHINTPPVAPSWHEPSVPKPLETLIQRLLAKSPDERPASAQDVAQELRRILDRSTVEPPLSEPSEPAGNLRGVTWGRFVGRREELDQLKAALENILSGKGSVSMLVGEPGIGKTRLAEEFAVYAGLRGAQALTGHCYEGEASIPYRPFVEALRQYARTRQDDALRQELGPGAPEVATLVSEIRQRFLDVEEAAPLEAEAERLRLFESVTQFIRNAAAANPLVLFLDDIHWADKPSLLLLQYLARSIGGDRVLIVGAYRDVELDRAHPLAEALGTLRRAHNYQRVLLRGLPESDVDGLLAGIEPSEESAAGRQLLAAAIHRETEGNPLFIREVLLHLIETGKIVHADGRWTAGVDISEMGIPEGVREVIGRRLSRLSDGCNRMLTLASTMTGGFTWDELKAVSPEPESALLDLLDEALGAQLIHERRGDAAGTYDFTHALIRQTLYQELSTPRRVLLHRQIGEALEGLHAGNIEPHLAELAHHFFQAAPGGDVARAIDYARRAGGRAVALFAWEEAVGHYERAVQAADLGASTGDGERCELLLALREAQSRSGDLPHARESARRALEIARTLALPEVFARAALAVRWTSFETFVFNPVLAASLEEALEGLVDGDSRLGVLVMLNLSSELYYSDAAERSLALGEEALEAARRLGDKATLALALRALGLARPGPENIEARLVAATEALRIYEELGDKSEAAWAHFQRFNNLFAQGDIPAAEAALEAYLRLAEEVREPDHLANAERLAATREVFAGRFEKGEQLARAALAVGRRARAPNLFVAFGVQVFFIRRDQGRLSEMEAAQRGVVERFPAAPAFRAASALMYADLEKEREARADFEHLAVDDFGALPRDGEWLGGMTSLAEACAFLRDADRAQALYEQLVPFAKMNAVVGAGSIGRGSVSYQLGLLAATMQRWPDAQHHFEFAIVMNARMGATPALARTQYDYARMLLARAGSGDRAKALGLLLEALNTAEELGMKKILESALALKLETQGLSSTSIYTSIDAVAHAVEHERPEISIHPAPDGTVTIMFSDIEDSTVLTERLGDQAWMELLRKHNALIRRELRTYNGFEVKTIGDCFMVTFQSAKKGLDCAIAIQRAFDGYNAADGEHVKVRIGLHAGETIKDGDDFYGKNVILASRVAGKAVGGEILVSSLLRQLVESSVNAGTFGEPREVELKGLSGTHTVFAVAST